MSIEIGYSDDFKYTGKSGMYMTVETGRYPDGMPIVGEIPKYYRNADTMIVKAKTLEEFVTAMFLSDAIWERGRGIQHLVIPHIPGGRQDRLNPRGDSLFTLKSVARMINDRQFDSVTVFDPHSTVTPALIDKCKVITTVDILDHVTLVAYDAVIAPDAGAGKRAYDVASEKGLKFLQAEKHRDVATGKLSGFACNGIEAGKRYLIVDDICDGGGTFIGLGQVILDAGAEVDLFVTHGIFSKGTDELHKIFKVVATTDTTDFDKHGAFVYDVVKWLIAR